MLRTLFAGPARKFAGQMLDFDDAVRRVGLVDAARQTQRRYIRSLRLFSAPLPAGPFLALSNHPGMVDTLALFSALNRPDLKIIAMERPFLKALTNTSQRLYYVTDDPGTRMSLVRQVSGHLRSGGAALTFPAGQIEPDPNVYPGATGALQGWTDSVGVFVRIAPETAILPVLVRGVIWEKTARASIDPREKDTRRAGETGRSASIAGACGAEQETPGCNRTNRQTDHGCRAGEQGYGRHPPGSVGGNEAPDRKPARR